MNGMLVPDEFADHIAFFALQVYQVHALRECRYVDFECAGREGYAGDQAACKICNGATMENQRAGIDEEAGRSWVRVQAQQFFQRKGLVNTGCTGHSVYGNGGMGYTTRGQHIRDDSRAGCNAGYQACRTYRSYTGGTAAPAASRSRIGQGCMATGAHREGAGNGCGNGVNSKWIGGAATCGKSIGNDGGAGGDA